VGERISLSDVNKAKAAASLVLNDRSATPMLTRELAETVARRTHQLVEEIHRLNSALRTVSGELNRAGMDFDLRDIQPATLRLKVLEVQQLADSLTTENRAPTEET
jgi:hypothetical protein